MIVIFAISAMLTYGMKLDATEDATADLAAYRAGDFMVAERRCEEPGE